VLVRGGNERHPGAQGLLGEQRPRLPLRGQDGRVGRCQQVRHVGALAEQPQRHPARGRGGCQRTVERARAGDREDRPALGGEQSERSQGARLVLLRGQPAGGEQQPAAGGIELPAQLGDPLGRPGPCRRRSGRRGGDLEQLRPAGTGGPSPRHQVRRSPENEVGPADGPAVDQRPRDPGGATCRRRIVQGRDQRGGPALPATSPSGSPGDDRCGEHCGGGPQSLGGDDVDPVEGGPQIGE
jgi:hypothetical protein